MTERSNAVSAMCQQLSQGLSLLSSTDDPFLSGQRVKLDPFQGSIDFEEATIGWESPSPIKRIRFVDGALIPSQFSS